MPVQFEVDKDKDLTILKLSGEVTYSEFIEMLNAYGESSPTIFELYDARDLSGDRISSAEVQKLAGYFKKYANRRPHEGKTAVVVNDDLDYGLSRMLTILTEPHVPYKIEVFRALHHAYLWLNDV